MTKEEMPKALRWGNQKLTTSEIHQLSDDDFSLFKERKRLSLAGKTPSDPKLLTPTMRARQRYAKDFVRKLTVKRNRKPRRNLSKQILSFQYRDSILLDSLVKDRRKKWVKHLDRREKRTEKEINLENFSFVDNPEKTMETLRDIALAECHETHFQLNFSDKYCLDIGPYLVLAMMAIDLSPVMGGLINRAIHKVLQSVNLHHHIRIAPLYGPDVDKDISPFPLYLKRPVGPPRTHKLQEVHERDVVADRFILKMNEWLSAISQQLSEEGEGHINAMIGELLDNAERHSDIATGNGNWAIAGFLAHREMDGKPGLFCSLGFLSVGNTISDSLATCLPATRTKIEQYCAAHSGLLKPSSQSKATLETVCAIQEGVTRDAEKDAAGNGGTGFQEVFDFFGDLGGDDTADNDPKLTIISGNSCISLKTPYLRGRREEGDTSPRVLWFNDENSRETPPSNTHVNDLGAYLGGTVISMAFKLDVDYLQRTASHEHN